MIDPISRAKYREQMGNKTLVNGLKDVITNNLKQGGNEEVLKLVVKHEDNQELLNKTTKLGDAIAMIYKAITRPLVFPKLYQIKGQVEVTRPIKVDNLSEVKKYFDSLETKLNHLYLAIQAMPQPQIKLPKIEIPANVKNDNSDIIAMLEKLNESMGNMGGMSDERMVMSLSKINQAINELVAKPTMIPQPVTNVQINALQGFAKATAETVTTIPITLPSYGQLFNRRSVIIFNNSASTTVYLGGSDVTAATGIPVLAQNYSPAIDAGYNLLIYGITAGGSADVRVFEVSKDQTANVQQ